MKTLEIVGEKSFSAIKEKYGLTSKEQQSLQKLFEQLDEFVKIPNAGERRDRTNAAQIKSLRQLEEARQGPFIAAVLEVKEIRLLTSLKALVSEPERLAGGEEWWTALELLCAFTDVNGLDEVNEFSDEEWKQRFGEISFDVAVAVQAMVIESASPIDMHWNPGSQPDWRPYQDVLRAHRRVRRLVPK